MSDDIKSVWIAVPFVILGALFVIAFLYLSQPPPSPATAAAGEPCLFFDYSERGEPVSWYCEYHRSERFNVALNGTLTAFNTTTLSCTPEPNAFGEVLRIAGDVRMNDGRGGNYYIPSGIFAIVNGHVAYNETDLLTVMSNMPSASYYVETMAVVAERYCSEARPA